MIKKMNYAMKKLLVFLFHLQLVHFFSCNEKGGNQSKHLTSEEDSLIVRAFVPPISLSPNNADSISRLFEEKILLDPLDQGFDSLQIRITFAYSSGNLQKDSQKILIIKRTKHNWYSEVRKVVPDSLDPSYFLVYSLNRDIQPKIGWAHLVKEFVGNKIFSIPFKQIEEEESVIHGPTVIIIEVATKEKYEFRRFYHPSFYEENHWQIKELSTLLKLLETQLKFSI